MLPFLAVVVVELPRHTRAGLSADRPTQANQLRVTAPLLLYLAAEDVEDGEGFNSLIILVYKQLPQSDALCHRPAWEPGRHSQN